jgi:predicted Zn-dependent protease
MKNILLSLMISFSACPVWAGLDLSVPDMNVPEMGDPASSVLSYTEEQDLGKKLYRQLRGSQAVIEDPELSAWIRSLGNRLVARASGTRGSFYFLIIDKPSVNAFAMPGGVIAVHTGLILNTESESELAAVLSHEIAHVSQRHIARMFAKNKGNAWKTGLGVLAGAIAASQDPALGQAVMTAAIASQMQKQLNFSRQAESEADRVGLRILTAAGFNPEGMPTFLGKLAHSAGAYQNITEYLRTHPLSIDRVSDTRARVKKYTSARNTTASYQDDPDYIYAKAKLQGLSRTRLKARGINEPKVQTYLKARKSLKAGHFSAALQQIGQGQRLAERLLQAQALNGLRKYEQSIALLRPLIVNYPDQEALLMPLLQAYLAKGEMKTAWQLMRKFYLSEQSSLQFLEMRQEVANAAGQIGEALLSAAERYIRVAEYKQAQTLLMQATRNSTMNISNEAKLQRLLNQVNEQLKQQKRSH